MIGTVVLVVVGLGAGVVLTLLRGNFMTPAEHRAGVGTWLHEEYWCPDGKSLPRRDGAKWETFESSYPAVVVAGGSVDGEFAYTVFFDVPQTQEWPSAVWADTNGNGRYNESDGPLQYSVLCPSGLHVGLEPAQ